MSKFYGTERRYKLSTLLPEIKHKKNNSIGSGINYNKKGLKTLINRIIDGEVSRLVITHKDRLLRFGAELIFAICEAKEVEVVIINKQEL